MKTLLKITSLSTISLFVLAAGLTAKTIGSGNVTTQPRNVSGFHAVDLLSSGSVIVTQGDTEGLVIEAEDNIIPLVETKVADGTLRIGFKSGEEIHPTKKVLFRLAVKNMDNVKISGSGDITAKALKTDHLAVKVQGSGDITVGQLESGAVAVDIDGSGNVTLVGKAASQTISIAGSGDYEGAGLKTGTAAVNIAGSGDCEVAASETLVANVSGSGDVSYYGKPAVTKHVTGSGTVDALGSAK